MPVKPRQLDIFRTSIPMRGFEHAAAARNTAEAIILRLEYEDGQVGWGETLPRDYVTGETLETVPADIEKIWPGCIGEGLLNANLSNQAETGKFQHKKIPAEVDGRCINAAVCGLELASLGRFLGERGSISPVIRQITGQSELLPKISARVSGVLGSVSPKKTAKRLRLMRLFGLCDFKLKLGLGTDIDRENLRIVSRKLKRGLKAGKFTLRVDINGGWDAETTPERIEELKQYDVCVVEQPVYCSAEELADLARKCPLPLMADESILTRQDADELLKISAETQGRKKIWWNIRLCKNGGLLRTLELLHLAARNEIPVSFGCMVGESSILSAVQRRALQLAARPRFVEGNYGKFLLSEDVCSKSLRFGFGGRMNPLRRGGLGIDVKLEQVKKLGKRLLTLHA